jgi:hypothetical protein
MAQSRFSSGLRPVFRGRVGSSGVVLQYKLRPRDIGAWTDGAVMVYPDNPIGQ